MEYIRTKDGCYFFRDIIDGIPTIRQVGASSKQEAVDIISRIPVNDTITLTKRQLVDKAKSIANQLLSTTDYKVIRHRDQLAIGVTTTLTPQEYEDLLTERNNIRIRSNEIEAEINALATIEELNNYKIEY